MATNSIDRQRTLRPSVRGALLLLGAGWLSVSPSHASVKGEWSNNVSRDQSFSRVLVVGISEDRNTRCGFERVMASMIRSADTVAIVSCDAIPQETPLTRESVEAALTAENADAVLTTSLVTSSWEAEEGGTRDSRGIAMYKPADLYYGFYGGTTVAVDFHASAPVTMIRGKARVMTLLYETSDATLVYTMDSKVKDIKSTDDGFLAITGPIGKKLRREGLIR